MRAERLAWAAAIAAGVTPLWVTPRLPFVDEPQHLHLITVLARIHDVSTLYPRLFHVRAALTPYWGYYAVVSALSQLMPVEIANKIFLSAYVAAMPLSMAFLLRSIGRPTWPALFAVPLAYGYNLAWGFTNYCAALPLTFLSCGLCVRAIVDRPRRMRMAVWLAASLIAVLLFHVMAFAFLVIALPFLMCASDAPDEGWLRARRAALAAVVPAAVLCAVWIAGRIGAPTPVRYGAPWQAWGPLFSPRNMVFKPFGQNLAELPQTLGNMLRDGSDRYGVAAVFICALAGLVAGLVPRWRLRDHEPAPGQRISILGLAAIALGLFFIVPFDVRGYVYDVNTRYAQLAALLVVASVPIVRPRIARALTVAAAAAAVISGAALTRGFAAYGREAGALDAMIAATGPRPMVMGLIFNRGSAVMTHPVYIHAGSVLAAARGGATNFSFALTPHSPIEYKVPPPPTFPSEWAPQAFDYRAQGAAYDHFLVRGADPAVLFGPALGRELYIAAQSGGFTLVRRR